MAAKAINVPVFSFGFTAAQARSAYVNEAEWKGSVLAGVKQGADRSGSHVIWGDEEGEYGELIKNSDGTYTYKVDYDESHSVSWTGKR